MTCSRLHHHPCRFPVDRGSHESSCEQQCRITPYHSHITGGADNEQEVNSKSEAGFILIVSKASKRRTSKVAVAAKEKVTA
jgi:hypothetical protein